jgi:dTMP kinase
VSRGLFITFEGIEGCGKSTQLSLLADWLAARGVAVETTREPGGTPLGNSLRALLLDPDLAGMAAEAELFLYLADRAQNVRERVRPALDAGRVVLCDRHADATLVYQGAMRGLGLERARALNVLATGGLVPDRTLLLDLPAGEGLRRVAERRRAAAAGGDRMEDEPPGFHEGIRRAYLELARSEPGRFLVIDAAGPREEVHARVVRAAGEWIAGGGA